MSAMRNVELWNFAERCIVFSGPTERANALPALTRQPNGAIAMAVSSLPKICTHCKIEKQFADFYTSPKGRTESWCRTCTAEWRRGYFQRMRPEKREEKNARSREYERLRKLNDPEYKARSIQTVRQWWAGLSPDQRRKLNQRKKLLKRYGVSLERYDELLRAQGGVCNLCGSEPPKNRLLHVDHCHATGKVRGLLCVRCNTSLGWFESIKGQMNRVLDYLELVHVRDEESGTVEFRGKVYRV
jgi:hypothetical protein